MTSVVTLPGTGPDINENAAIWSANEGKLARQALQIAFGRITELLPRTLALTADDVKAMNGKDREKMTAGGFAGRLQEASSSGTLLWSGGFIHVEPLY